MTTPDGAPVASTSAEATGAAVPPPSHPSLFLVRHGETEWSKSGQHTSNTDLPLTENGEAVALALKPVLEAVLGGQPPALALSSPLQRARRTAELLGVRDLRDDEIVLDDRWHAGTGITFPPSRGPYDTSPDGADRLGAAPDHPMTLLFPEGEYLKGLAILKR